MKRTVFITGATGVMGFATLQEFLKADGDFNLRLLVRDSKKNRKKLAKYIGLPNVEVVWGDLLDADAVDRAMGDADIVLHIGGMVSPAADYYPEQTLKVNIGGAHNVVQSVLKRQQNKEVGLVYIGSVAEYSNRMPPYHWGRTGDPVMTSVFDYYGVSKIKAEREVIESGVKKWVVLRQSGILHADLLRKTDDPIMFHVPLRGVLEWATLEDSARLMVGVSQPDVPEKFWNKFYNIGSGAEYRLTNYEFEKKLLKATGCPAPEKAFDADWFALRNFHGQWYIDGDRLEAMVPFRANVPVDEYFRSMAKKAPWWIAFAPLAPAFIVKMMMKKVAHTPKLGTLYWLEHNEFEDRIKAFFGSRKAQAEIGGWKDMDLSRPSDEVVMLNHGYDETKPVDELDIDDMRKAAEFRGGKCLSESMNKGMLDEPLEWECAFGHKFRMRPNSVLKGGHWCEKCLPAPWNYDEESKRNPFMAQLWKNKKSQVFKT